MPTDKILDAAIGCGLLLISILSFAAGDIDNGILIAIGAIGYFRLAY